MRAHFLPCLMALILTAGSAFAAEPELPAELFARHAQYSDAQLSPTGEYLSVVTPLQDRRGLSIIQLSGDYRQNMIKFGPKETIADVAWVGDRRLVVSKARDVGYLEKPLLTGDVYATDADGGNQKQLFGFIPDDTHIASRFKDDGIAQYMGTPYKGTGEAYFSFSPFTVSRNDTEFRIFAVDATTGKRREVGKFPGGDIAIDNAGDPRFNWGEYVGGEHFMLYRPNADSGWVTVPATVAGLTLEPLKFESDNIHAYVKISDKGEPAALYRLDLSTGNRERLAGNAEMEIARVLYAGQHGAPFAVMYNSGKPKIDYIDPASDFAKLHAGLMGLFRGELVEFIDFTRDDGKILFLVHSDRHPGAYYLLDRSTMKPQLLFEIANWIDPSKMAPVRPVEIKNASGQTLYGLYTTPVGKSGPLPLVVIPHGGPFGIEDQWGFDSDAQFLASRGYAVLQVNFRGSSGRGENFEHSTYRQWGTGIQDDIADGVRWAIAQNLADSKRICIYGGSFGGYSAMMNPIRNPGMYRCAIGFAGVYDLPKRLGSDPVNHYNFGHDYVIRTMGDDATELAAQSPTRLAGKMDVPVLLIHGTADRVVPIHHLHMMESALNAAGKPVETMEVPNEEHGFYDVKNQTEAFERIEAFLRKYNPPD
jgi:dienelactone hydrolase